MADSAEPRNVEVAGDRRYSAFISYSHADARFSRWLHRKLENYRLPRRLRMRADPAEFVGARLKPIFRDTEELTAAFDLTAAVREAIAQSDYLIVVCSPRAAGSSWVSREIDLFRRLHGDDDILTVLAAGEPAEAFPPALRGAEGFEPLAADFRREQGSQHLAFLKLVAALAGVRLDELVHRDAQQRIRGIALGATGAVATLSVMATLGFFAYSAKSEADAQRRRAGSLGEFMLSDLRKGLEGAGRHDLLAQVNQAALNSYGGQDLGKLTPDQQMQQAKALQAAGEDAEKAGDLKKARQAFERAFRITGPLLAAKPDDPKRIFAHAQSEYWMGFVNLRAGNGVAARDGFQAYAKLAARLVAIDPKNDDWVKETAYAANNLGMLALRQAGDPVTAQRHLKAKLAALQQIEGRKPGNPDILKSMANGYAWLADCQRLQGDYEDALASREAERSILTGLLARDPRNAKLRESMLGHDLAVARIDAAMGHSTSAVARLESGRQAALALAQDDPLVTDYVKQARMFELFKVRTWLTGPRRSRPRPEIIAKLLGDCRPATPAVANPEIDDFCATLLARARTADGDGLGARQAIAPVLLHTAVSHNVLTAHWGLDLAAESKAALASDEPRPTREPPATRLRMAVARR